MKNLISLLIIVSILLTATLLIAQVREESEAHLEGGRHLTEFRNPKSEIPITSSHPLTPKEERTIKAIIEDFQVNENVGNCNQYDLGKSSLFCLFFTHCT